MFASCDKVRTRCGAMVMVAIIASGLIHGIADAQVTAVAADAIVSVEGQVMGVFASDSGSLVQVLVQKSEVPDLSTAAKVRYPAPGGYVYVHMGTDQSRRGPFGRRASEQLPNLQDEIQASLMLDPRGQWINDGDNWFQSLESVEVATPAGTQPSDGVAALGVTTQRVKLGQDTGLKVVSVVPGSPAQAAGIEPGDVLVAANRTRLESEPQLGELYAQAKRGFSLTVRDVRSGRDVDVDVETMPAGLGASVPGANVPATGRPAAMKPLGVATKLAFLSGSPVLEITAVDAGSPAQRAGLAAGWLIVEANGIAAGSPEELTAQEQQSRGRLELKVVDPSDRRERIVRVDL